MSPHPRELEKAYEADDDDEYDNEVEERKEDENELSPPTSTSTLMRVQRRKRKRQKAPRHPEIDLSLNTHNSSCQFQQMRSSRQRRTGPVSLQELSRNLIDFFDNRHYWEAYYPRKLETEKQDQDNDDDMMRPSKKSRKSFVIEEALSLSTKARLLIEAKRPHRVVHANAAYSHLRSRPPHPTTVTKYNNLDAAIQNMFPDLPVSIYPVWASEGCVVTHYLVEFAGKESILQRFPLHSNNNSGEPAQMVG